MLLVTNSMLYYPYLGRPFLALDTTRRYNRTFVSEKAFMSGWTTCPSIRHL